MSKKYSKSTLEFYNYGENNMMTPAAGPAYKVKVSDKDGNIITIEKDGSLFAMVGLLLDVNTGVLQLIDKAHDDSTLAEIELPDADYIYNCRFDEEKNAILFDVKSLYGNETSTIELDVESLVELYEAGQGIEIGEKNEITGRKPISIKLAEGENILQVSDSGLSISDSITTDDELEAAISGKADIEYVNEVFSGISGISGDISSIIDSISGLTEDVEKIFDIIGTEEDDPNLDERIDSKADLDEFNDLEEEVGELEASLNELSGDVVTIKEDIDAINAKLEEHDDAISDLSEEVDELSGTTEELENKINELSGEVEDNKVFIEKVVSGLPSDVREAYILKNNIGEQLGERIDIYNNKSIQEISYTHYDDEGHEGQFLKIVYESEDGSLETVYIDFSEIVIEPEFADGLQVTSGIVSVKIDETSDSYLTVSENGIKLSGVAEFLASLVEVNNQQWAVINQNRTDLENVDAQLWEAIGNEITQRENGDGLIQHNLEIEIENRENADALLDDKIAEEIANRIASESAISESIDEKVQEERERAILAETNLGNRITSEENARQREDERLENLINQEVENREAEDLSIRREILPKISAISGSVDSLNNAIYQERADRMAADDSINAEISGIKDLYAKKEYVDSKDAEYLITAVSSATTLANEYSDLKNDYLEAELKLYCDSGHTELQNAISDNTTKINVISNLKGVSGSDSSNYDDTGNGILDVLHREFHQYKGETIHNATGAQIRNVDEVAVGRYNISNRETDQMSGVDIPSGCTIFSIGIGTSDSLRKNALEVRQDGSIYMWIEGEYMCINKLLAMLTHETY